MVIPELEHNCNSWVVVSKKTGQPILETWKRDVVEAINLNAYEVLTALQWLTRFNQSIREA